MAFNIFDDYFGAPFRMLGMEPSQLPIVGGLHTDPAEEEAQRRLEEMSAEMQRMRPIYQDAQMQGLGQQLAAMQPANQMLGQMMGGSGPAIPGLGQAQSPLPSEAFATPPHAEPDERGAGSELLASLFPAPALGWDALQEVF